MPDKDQALALLAVAGLTTVLDLLFHAFETSPMESPAYFTSKFVFALVAVGIVFLANMEGFRAAFAGAAIFDALIGVWYYVVYYLPFKVNACVSNCNVHGVPNSTWFYVGWFPFTETTLAFIFLHGAFFLVAYLLLYWIGGD